MPTPDFSKVWASNSPLPAYTFSDNDYITGWDFVGSAPPTKNEFDAWFKLVDTKLNWLYNQMRDTASKLYPVGSVYISFNSADPSTLFGGTWKRLKDTFLLANGDSFAPNTTGGSAAKNITVDNLPAHTHSISTDGSHTHTRGSMNIVGTFGTGSNTPSLYRNDTGGAFYNSGSNGNRFASGNTNNDRTSKITFDASRNWSGETSWNGSHSHVIGNTGSSLPLNIMPPYQTVYMWKRTA